MTPPDALPPLVLSCRTLWRVLFGGGALFLLVLGTATLASAAREPEGSTASILAGVVLLLFGAGCAQFFLRYCTARLILDDAGFGLEGPLLAATRVRWDAVTEYRVRHPGSGPASVRLRHVEGRRLSVPLIYEEAHLLEVGLGQRGFPRF